jgi:outer membrane protein
MAHCNRNYVICSTLRGQWVAGAWALALTVSALPARGEQIRLTAQDAVALALRNNLSLQQEKLSSILSQGPEEVAQASFEPALFAELSGTSSPGQVSFQRAGLSPNSSASLSGQLGVRKVFSTGTSGELGLSSTGMTGGGTIDPAYQSAVTLSISQSLLRGLRRTANEIQITTARHSRDEARQTLRQQAEQIAASTLETYFNLQAALAQDAIQALAIRTTETTLRDTQILIAGGRLAASEEISVRYALQTQQRTKLETTQAVEQARDQLARLIGLVRPSSLDTPALVTVETLPALPDNEELTRLQAMALQRRGDYLATISQVAAQQEKVRALQHFLLPKLDLIGSAFLTGLSGEASSGTLPTSVKEGYWASYRLNQLGWSVGLSLEVPLGNHKAKAELKNAELELRRAQTAAEVVQQNISEELNRAWRAVRLARDQLELSKTAVQVVQTKLQNEEALYKKGKTTAHLLAAVQAEVAKELLAGTQASTSLHQAIVRLHATAGNLLARLRLEFQTEPAPGT